ncbi:hypothetical protein [Variovorax sp. J22R115]|uniref:hypothetical protein n=1 Tax=Variovorax sp. J22R115 TaxID=3053509 RepID=UPI002576EBC6|nr:hypothetical protein [Variovorax sp. J22R115]MDM0052014.1 hypothetical protein [Variovorax sp. J22R115]
MSIVSVVDLGALPQAEVRIAGFEARDDAALAAPPALKPIESAEQFFSALDSMRAHQAHQERAEVEARRVAAECASARAKQSAYIAAVAQTRDVLTWFRYTLGNLRPPPDTREAQMVKSLLGCIDAFSDAPMPRDEARHATPDHV